MHHIQQFILNQLAENPHRRYSDMKPSTMEPGQFMYHLKQLIGVGLVEKHGSSYQLSDKGIQYVDRLNEESLEPVSYPRVTVALLYKSSKGYLFARRDKQPGLGNIGFLLVDVPLDFMPDLKTFSETKFKEISGVKTKFKHRADGYIRVTSNGRIIANMLTHIFLSDGEPFDLKDNNLLWQKDMVKDEPIFGSTELIINELAKHSSHFFFEQTISV